MPEPALLVVGMHRSGTSMVGGMLAAAGVRMGQDLIPADRANARGYFEERGIVELHGRLFREYLPADDGPHVDWGVTATHELRAESLAPPPTAWLARAAELAAELGSGGGPWGFKDPRTTMALPLWEQLLPDARFLLVYRFPWEVADSMQRGGATEFQRSPAFAYRAWQVYTERLLAFQAQHRERCLLVCSGALTARASAIHELARLLDERLGVDLDPAALASGVDGSLFTAGDAGDRRADLVDLAYPRCTELLRELDAAADLSGAGLWRSERPGPTRLGPTRLGSKQLGLEDQDRDDVAPEEQGSTDVAAAAEPELSIVLPTWNDGVLLLEAVASAERHAPAGSELLIVDDGSTDPETLRVLGCLEEGGYHVLHKPNGGLSSARNAGIRAARGRFVLPLDADNRLLGGFLEEALAILRRDGSAEDRVDVVYGDRRLFGAMDGELRTPDVGLEQLLGGNKLDACALFRRELWEELGGYDTAMTGLEDWEFWLGAADRGRRFLRLARLAFEYRVRADSLLAVSLRRGVRRRLFARILDRHTRLFHRRVPLPLRLGSLLLSRLPGRLLGGLLGNVQTRLLPRLRRLEAALYWQPLWFLIGPGGLVSADREQVRAHRGA